MWKRMASIASPCFEVDLIWNKLKSPDGKEFTISEGSL